MSEETTKKLFIGICCLTSKRNNPFWEFSLKSRAIPYEEVSWVPPEKYHMSLAFIGEVDEKQENVLRKNLSKLKAKSFDLSFNGTAFLPHACLSVIAELSPRLINLKNAVDSARGNVGELPYHSMFIPHVILGKIDEIGYNYKKFWEEQKFKYATHINCIHLYESIKINGQTEYRILESYLLED
jgi:2'-5' RNA ligase